jgi:hypothetical protein
MEMHALWPTNDHMMVRGSGGGRDRSGHVVTFVTFQPEMMLRGGCRG